MTNANIPVAEAPVAVGAPLKCPRHARKAVFAPAPVRSGITLADLHREPFRLFFPVAVLAGIVGVALWPLMLAGWMTDYPGPRHARLMIEGFFGGFVFGFLGTSLPRFIEAPALKAREVFPQLVLHLAVTVAYTFDAVALGDGLFVAELGLWLFALLGRLPLRRDLPPPSFVLVAMSFVTLLMSFGIQWAGRRTELAPGWELLGRLLGYHGFILLCMLGAGAFLLPRFLGLGVRQKFPESRVPTPEWRRAASTSAVAGALVIASYLIEAAGWPLAGPLLRAGVVCGYLFAMMPLERLRWTWNGVQWLLVVGLAFIPLGILAAGLWPGWRIALSHIELIGGFGLITFGVATRVVFGHSGQRLKLERFHGWLTTAAILMLLGMLSRISGDLIPSTMVSHYLYGVFCWGAGLIIWAVCVLPGVLRPDPEG